MKRRRSNRRLKIILFKGRSTQPCKYCGKTLRMCNATLDHVKAISKGGYDKLKNGELACNRCNQLKKAMSVDEFMKVLSELKGSK